MRNIGMIKTIKRVNKAFILCGLVILTACSTATPSAVSTIPSESLPAEITEKTPETLPSPTEAATQTPDDVVLTTTQPTAAPTDSEPAQMSTGSIPDAALYRWKSLTDGLSLPVSIANAGDGTGRLFILEQDGLIRWGG